MKAKTTLQSLYYYGSRVINETLISLDIQTNKKLKNKSRKNFKKAIVPLLLFVVLGIGKSWGQLSITSTGTAFTQNFNGMGSSATATIPAGFRVNGNGATPSWTTGTTATTVAAGTSGTGALTGTSGGGTYNFANGVTASSTDRSLGFLTSGSFASPNSIILNFTNNTGVTVTNLSITFDYEKYRAGTRAWNMTFFHGNTVNPTTSATAGDQAYAADGANAVVNPPTTISKTVTLTGLSIANGTNYYIKWTSTGSGGATNSQGIGLDTFSITASAATTPTISTTGTLSAVNTTYGSPSASPSTFSVSGADMTAGILVNPPAGYQVSTVSDFSSNTGTNGAGITIGTSGTISATTIYVRLLATATYSGSPYSGNVVLSSSGATSVNVATASSTVTRKGLTITGISGVNKVYDRLTTATLSGTAAYSGLENGETFSVTGTPIASFATVTVGTGISITVTGYTPPSTNYTLTQPTAAADITQKPLTITGITANNKVFDGNTSATLLGTAALSGVISPDVVTVGGSPVATFVSSAIATGIAVTVTGYTIGGADAGNYSITQPAGLTADITSASAPAISTTGTLLAVNTTYGTASASPSTFSVSGVNMTAGILVTPPSTSFEVSTAIGGPYTNTITVGAAGTIVSTAVYIRLKPTATVAGSPYSGNIVLSSSGASNVNVATVSSTVTAKGLTITGIAGVNKVYDRTTTATLSGTPSYVGLENSESFSVTGTPVANFSDFLVGTSKTIIITGYTAPNSNYSVTQPTGLTANITQKALTVTGATVTSKTYTGTNPATITGGSLSGVVSPDVVTFSGGGTFTSVNVGTGISVTAALTLGGVNAGNYSLTQPTLTGNITTAPLTITGLTGANKVYDGNTTASFTGTAAYSGLQNSESFAVTGSPTATFANKTVANSKPITISGYTAPSGNYTVSQPTGLTGNITAFNLTVTGAIASNKVYDRLNTATITSSTLVGVIGLDVVTITTSGTFASINVASGIGVTSTQTLVGADAGNYTVTLPTGLTANITQKALTITSAAASNKVYDGNTTATITGTLSGIISPDVVTLSGTGTFASSAIANGIAVTSTSTLAGAQAGNYSLTQPTGLTANITPNALSTITTDGTYGYSQNIAYINFQTTPVPASAANSVGVHNIILTDGADADSLPTILATLNYTYTGTANSIRAAALFTTTNSKVAEATTISSNSIAFSGLSGANVTALDNSNVELILRVTYTTTVTDNQKLVFTVSGATVAGSNTSSSLSSFGAVSDNIVNDNNRIEVTADRLAFVQQPPTSISTGASMTPAPSVDAEDIHSNRDLDFVGIISITSSGTLSSSPQTATASSGVATFSTINHTAAGTGLQLIAAFTGFTNGVSNTFAVTLFTEIDGDYRPIADGANFSFGGSAPFYWQVRTSGVWTNTAVSPQTAKPTRILIDKQFVYGAGTTTNRYNDIYILNGGSLWFDDNDNPPVASEIINANKRIEVQSGGELHIEGDIDMPATGSLIVRNGGALYLDQVSINYNHPIWEGIEVFEGGSTVIINDWGFTGAGSGALINGASTPTIAANANGYIFGNLIVDITAAKFTNTWSLVGGSLGIVNLCENNFDINNESTNFIYGATNRTGTNGFVVNGNLTIFDGPFSFGFNFDNNLFNHQFIVNGNFECASDDVLKVNHVNGALTNNLSGSVTFKGDVIVANTVTSFLNEGGTTIGNTRMSVNFEGGTLASPKVIDIAPTAVSMNMNLKNSGYRKLRTQDLIINSVTNYTAVFTVETGSTLDFSWAANNTTPLVIKRTTVSAAGTNSFISAQGSTLVITAPDGINIASGTTGASGQALNLQMTSVNTINPLGTFWYKGKTNQRTGTCFGTSSNGRQVIVELGSDTTTLSFDSTFGLTNDTFLSGTGGKLDIRKGQVIESDTAYITGTTGTLYMSANTLYRVSLNSASTIDLIPRMTGATFAYSLQGGTIELSGATAGTGYQYLRGARDYYGLTFSGGGNKFISSALTNLGDNATINLGLVTIKDNNTVLDVLNNDFSGNAALTMINTSLFRMSLLNQTLPQLLGTYTMTGGTVELYGSSATQTHSLRGSDGSSVNINYNNIELNSTGANVTADLNTSDPGANVVAQAGFGIKGTMNVNSPTCFKLASTFTITDAGAPSVFEIKPGATFKYGGSIETTGASGNVLTDTRTFPTTASYGFVGATTQTTGAGLPSSMVNLYMDKDASTNFVTLSNSTTVTGALTFYKGKLDIATNNLTVGSSGSITGASVTDYVVTSSTGTLVRNIAASGTFNYPIGTATAYNPSSFVWSASPGITSYSLRYVASTATTGTGLPASAGCVSAGTLVNNGHWVGTSVGTAINSPAITFTRNGHTNAGANLNLHAILRRDSSASAWGVAGTWSDPGATTISPAGTGQVSLSQTALATTNNFSGEFAIATGLNAASTAAVLSAAAATICLNTSPSLSVAITGSGSLYDLLIFDGTSNFSITNYTSGTPFAAPATSTPKTYSITSVTIGGSCAGSGNSGTPTVAVGGTSTYNLGWTPSAPTITSTAVITSNYNQSANINACSLTVSNNSIVIIPSTYKVTLSGSLTVDSGSSFTLENDSNLVQTAGTTNPNTGSIQVKRNSSSLYLLDYTLWSSPVENQNLYTFSPRTLGNRFYVFDTSFNQYSPIASSNNFTVGKGYLIRVPKDYSLTTPAIYNGLFTGKPNSGTINIAISDQGPTIYSNPPLNTIVDAQATANSKGFNAVGNPYPSQINVHDFLDANPSTSISGTLYFWRKKNDQYATSYATLTRDDYAANAATGGDTGSAYFNATTSSDWVLNVGQGFFVQATSATNLVFTNTMRRGENNGNQFFRTSNKTTSTASKYKLNLTSNNGFFSQMALSYGSDYTLGVDKGVDAFNINSNYLCSSIEGVPYVIQGRPEFTVTDVVPLIYKIPVSDEYSIAIDLLIGVFVDQDVFLKDKLTNTIHNLKTGSYTFSSELGSFTDRFEVLYENPLAVIQPTFNENSVVVYKQNQEVVINTGKIQMSNVKIYDIRGRLLVSKNNINASQIKLYAGSTQQVLIVKITSDIDVIVTKKVIN